MGVGGEREKELASVLSGSESLVWLLLQWWWVCCGWSVFVVIGSVGVVCFAHVLQGLYEKCTLDTVLGRGVGGHITLCISRAGVG